MKKSNVLILGITFKENCPDIRNTKVVDIYEELKQYGLNVDIYDPWADEKEVKDEYNIEIMPQINNSKKYEAVVVTVAHKDFVDFNFKRYKEEEAVIFDTKSFINREFVDGRL